MAQNFLACDREQELLLPPSLREWLPEGHLAWFVIDAVAQLDLSAFYAGYRTDGHGRAAHDPAMMVALLLYCYAMGSGRRGGSSAVVSRMSRSGWFVPTRRPITRRSRGFVSAMSARWASCSARRWRSVPSRDWSASG
jgi:hypothetical protein